MLTGKFFQNNARNTYQEILVRKQSYVDLHTGPFVCLPIILWLLIQLRLLQLFKIAYYYYRSQCLIWYTMQPKFLFLVGSKQTTTQSV